MRLVLLLVSAGKWPTDLQKDASVCGKETIKERRSHHQDWLYRGNHAFRRRHDFLQRKQGCSDRSNENPAREYGKDGFRINAIIPGRIIIPGTKTVAREIIHLQMGLLKTGMLFTLHSLLCSLCSPLCTLRSPLCTLRSLQPCGAEQGTSAATER